MDLVDAIARSNGLSIWKLADGAWQVSTKNRDGSFSCHSGPLKETLDKALGVFVKTPPAAATADTEDDWRALI